MDTFLGRALTDPATGLPNLPYFRLIQNWEERRARRRRSIVRVVRVHVGGGSDAVRRTLLWRLCQELRTSDLIASDGRDDYHILLTSPDAENAAAIATRVSRFAEVLNDGHPAGDAAPVALETAVEDPPEPLPEKGPCDPCEEHELLARQERELRLPAGEPPGVVR